MIPSSSIKYFPKLYQEDTKAIALAAFLDKYIDYWKDDVKNIKRLIRPDECPATLLDELGYFVNAGIQNIDSETAKREKIYGAIEGHKYRSTFIYDVKIKIDSITGLNSAIISNQTNNGDWIMMTGESFEPPVTYWATMMDNYTDIKYGLDLFGDGTEFGVWGNIYINCHVGIFVSTLTAAQIQQIRDTIIIDNLPAYFYVYLSYINTSGFITVYPNGSI